MPAIVTLDIYSGLPNPTWVLDDDKVQQLQNLSTTRAAAAAKGPLPVLGYRGFIVRPADSPDAPGPRIKGLAEAAPGTGAVVVAGIPEAEQFLLQTAEPHIDEEVKKLVEESISHGVDAAVLQRAEAAAAAQCPACHAADAPVYNPAFWNDPAHQSRNNCYNYANNQRTDTFAQPGRATGHPITALSCPGVQPSAVSDGLRACPNFTANLPAGRGWYVALVIWPGRDYHWYRQDKVGCWSHKPGQTAARNTDNAGHAITDPRTCNRGPYTVFCTYMITTRTVHIR